MTLCKCGCGQEVKPGNMFINGHNACKTPWAPLPESVLCECGCGGYANPGKRFIRGHHPIERDDTQEKAPLPDGWQSKLSDITLNKNCATYLGDIAETILSRMYKNVQVMPHGNHGYDFICIRDKKIDVKSSATGDKIGRWGFNICKNRIANIFLCIAFNSRNDLHIPIHLWMIPGHAINHLTNLKISKTTVEKWAQYELPIDEIASCCDKLKTNEMI